MLCSILSQISPDNFPSTVVSKEASVILKADLTAVSFTHRPQENAEFRPSTVSKSFDGDRQTRFRGKSCLKATGVYHTQTASR